MTTDLPETVQDAANKLISALALDESFRDTVESALADMYDAGRDSLNPSETADTLRAIRSDAEALRAGTTLTRTVPASRIIGRVDELLALLDSKSAADEETGAEYEPVLTKGPADPAKPWLLSRRDNGLLRESGDPATPTAFATEEDAQAYADQLAQPDPADIQRLHVALNRALDLLDTATGPQRTQIHAWIDRARKALDNQDTAAIRALPAEPYVTGGAR